MKAYKVTFEDGNNFISEMNATLKEARAYYVGKYFQFGDTEEHPKDKMVKAVSVEEIKTYEAAFTGRQRGADGIFFHINVRVEGTSKQEAELALYKRFEHLSHLNLTEVA